MTVRKPYLDADGGLPPAQGAEPVLRALTRQDDGRVLAVTRSEPGGPRTVGVYEVTPDGLRWHPAVDVQRLAERGQVVATLGAVALVGLGVARSWAQGRPSVGRVTMGPGGSLSVRAPRAGARLPAAHATGRPWWARLLGADRLVVQRRCER